MMPHAQLRSLHRTLAVGRLIVPASEREAWRAEWVAELSHAYRSDPQAAQRLALGMVPDALSVRWLAVCLRVQSVDWRSPDVCLRVLCAVFVALLTVSMVQPLVRHMVFSRWGHGAFACFLVLACFSVPSAVATSRYGAYESFDGEAGSARQRMARWRFLLSKLFFVVLSSYLLAVQVTRLFQALLAAQADWLLVLCGLVFNVVGVTWVLTDQRARCPTCMRSLRSPARMGAPSWSLLDCNGMEEMCDRGHGLLHQPDWETSWFENARWLQLDRTWREFFRP